MLWYEPPKRQRRCNVKKDGAFEQRMRELVEDIERTKGDLARAYNAFDYTVEPELVEACVYEISAIQARYSYLMRKIKEHHAAAAAMQGAKEGKKWG